MEAANQDAELIYSGEVELNLEKTRTVKRLSPDEEEQNKRNNTSKDSKITQKAAEDRSTMITEL